MQCDAPAYLLHQSASPPPPTTPNPSKIEKKTRTHTHKFCLFMGKGSFQIYQREPILCKELYQVQGVYQSNFLVGVLFWVMGGEGCVSQWMRISLVNCFSLFIYGGLILCLLPSRKSAPINTSLKEEWFDGRWSTAAHLLWGYILHEIESRIVQFKFHNICVRYMRFIIYWFNDSLKMQ